MHKNNNKLYILMPIIMIILIKTLSNNKIISLFLALVISHKLLMEIVKLERKIIKFLFKTDQ